MVAAIPLLYAALVGAPEVVVITDANLSASPFPWGQRLTGMQPLPGDNMLNIAEDALNASIMSESGQDFVVNDAFLAATTPGWDWPAGAKTTRPWVTGFSSPRLLGGIATHNKNNNTWTPDYDYEFVTRAAGGGLVYNWSRIDTTLDAYVHAERLQDMLIVLDNVPYAFVKEENRYYGPYGLSSAPDDPEEYGAFIGDVATHFVERYGKHVVSTWRFRLGTECDHQRYGPDFKNFTAPNPPFTAPNGRGGTFTTRVNGLQVYVDTYIAVSKALKRVVPGAGFGPSNMAGIDGGHFDNYLTEFVEKVRAAGASVDFVAASEYSQQSPDGLVPVRLMGRAAATMDKMRTAAKRPDLPMEVQEWGWATWGKYSPEFGEAPLSPMGAFGGAWNFGSLLHQRKQGISRVLHWLTTMERALAKRNASATCVAGTVWCSQADAKSGVCTPTCRFSGNPIVTGQGWAFNALHYLSANNATLSEFVADLGADGDDAVGAVKSVASGRVSYLLLHFSGNVSTDTTRRFKVHIAESDLRAMRDEKVGVVNCAALAVQQQVLNRTTSTLDAIEADLHAHGLKAPGTARWVQGINKMTSPEGVSHLALKAAHWTSHNRRSLQFSAFDGDIHTDPAGGCYAEVDIQTPSLTLLTFAPPRSTASL